MYIVYQCVLKCMHMGGYNKLQESITSFSNYHLVVDLVLSPHLTPCPLSLHPSYFEANYRHSILTFGLFFFFFFLFAFSRAALPAYGGSQARGQSCSCQPTPEPQQLRI